MFNALVPHDSRLRSLTMDERDRLRSIADRARRVSAGERPEYGRLHADILTMLRIVGGEFDEDQERLLWGPR